MSGIVTARHLKRVRFITSLQINARQWMTAAKRFGFQRDHQPAIGKWSVMPRVAHAVGAIHVWFGNTGDHNTASAHAKGKQVSLAFCHQLIIGSPQNLQVFAFAVFVVIDHFLWLFDSQPHLKGFGQQRQPGTEQHFIGIPSTVANGENAL